MTYPAYLRVAQREEDLPAPAGARRRYALRYPGDSGPPRWLWSPWTEKDNLAAAPEVLAWFVGRGLLPRKVVPRRYSVAFAAPCVRCAVFNEGRLSRPCPEHGRAQVTHEHCLVDRDASPSRPRAEPLRTWAVYDELRNQAWKQVAVKNYQRQAGRLAPDLRGVGVLALCEKLRRCLEGVRCAEATEARQYVGLIEALERQEKRDLPLGRVGAARAIKRCLTRRLAQRGATEKPARLKLQRAVKLATDIERKFSRRTTS